MPTWGEVLSELRLTAEANPAGQPDFDGVRRKYLSQLRSLTNRDTILYYTDWLVSNDPQVMISLEDMQAMMEVCKDLQGPGLDLILHTPGGSPEAAASLVHYLRQKFDHIRVFVPLAAMSAGTMLTLACDEIVMGKHSQLGPIDPQMFTGQRYAPARAIIDQFDRAKREISDDPASLQAWFPILQQYGVSLLEECEAAEKLGRRLVAQWLREGMFASLGEGAAAKAEEVAAFFADFPSHQSHSLGITRAKAEQKGLTVSKLEDNQAVQDAVLTVHHATMHTLGGPAVKIVENHLHRAYVKLQQQGFMPFPQVQIQPGP
jgi:hypothetical protein